MAADAAIRIEHPIPGACRSQAAALFWEAFSAKLTRTLGPRRKARAFVDSVLDPAHGIGALDPAGRLVGLAGFKTDAGALVGGDLKDLRAVYGVFGGLWRGLLLSTLERPLASDTLLMDGIVVARDKRGAGIGSALLAAVKDRARALRKSFVRLDVIDANPRARSLYERQGFVAGETSDLGILAPLFGFRRATMMTFAVNETTPRSEGSQPPGNARPSVREK